MPNFTLACTPAACGRWARGLATAGLLVLGPRLALAQSHATVSGQVTASPGAAPEMVTVTLHRATDSVAVKTEYTDKQGVFQLEAAAGKRYRVSATQLGYKRYWSPAFELPAAGVKLGAIRLVASQATALGDVAVTGHQPLYEHRADRTVVNVAESPLAAGATALEVLGRAPNVSLTASSDLRLRGREGLLVYLDGKRVPLSGPELADYLRALPADQIQTIDLITNPPASYDAQGGAGVIDIRLKRDQRLGTNGSVNASYGRGEYGKFVGGGALNYRRKNLNLYGTYAYNDRRNFVRLNFERQYGATATLPAASSQQFSKRVLPVRSHSAKVGLDLNLSKRTLVGISVTGLASQSDNTTASNGQFFDDKGKLSSQYTSAATQDINRPNGSVNLNLRHTFADSATASTLTADADYARYHATRLLNLYTYYDQPTQAMSLLTGDQLSNLSIGTARVDYSQPLPHRTRLEAGAKATQVVSDNDILFTYTQNGQTTPLPNISQGFTYHENVNAAYANLRGALASTSFQAGLRAEQTNIRAEVAGTTVREQHYLQLFPSVLVQRSLSKNHALALAVARRIDRPTYGQFNPLRIYIEATSYGTGNPNLVPQTSYNFELTHTYKGKFSAALAYARTDQPIVSAVQPATDGSRTVVNMFVNLNTQNFYTLTLTAPLELTKWWTLYANGLLYYNHYKGYLNNTTLDRGGLAFNLTANNSFVLPHGWTAELNGLYESREVFNFLTLRDRGQLSFGLQKGFWNKQATLRLGMTDVFYTTPLHVASAYDNFSETYYQREDFRVVTAALTYRFGSSKVAAARKRAAGADEELRRAAGGQ